ncbi:MAG: hypothetical protein FWD50_00150 [Betaproteobacteria bacterium]|nr:hypothetical protein [Betaproteobacteria bacterium]
MAYFSLTSFSACLYRSLVRPGLILAVAGAALSLPVRGEQSDFTIGGFGTLGMARTSTNDVEFVRDLSQPRGARKRWTGNVDSVLGLQANWRIHSEFEAVVQGVSRYRYDRSYTPEIAWAYLKVDPSPTLSMRFGRLGTEFFMLADSRLVGYSYLPVRPPGDYFWFLPFSSINGADVALTMPLADNTLRGKIYYGIADGKIPLDEEQWNIGGSPMMGAYLEYQAGPWLLRGSYANIRFNSNLPIAQNFYSQVPHDLTAEQARTSFDYLQVDGKRSHYYSLGVVYDNGPWQFQLMLNSIDQGSRAFADSYAGYVLAGYRIGSVTPYIGYSWVRSKHFNPSSLPAVAQVQADSFSWQDTTIVGARWDVARNLALKVQWDAVRGDAASIFPFRRERPEWDGRVDVFSLTMDFVF